LIRANTAALLALLIVVALSLAAIRQAFQAQHNAQEASLAQRNAELQTQQARAAEARALLHQVRAQRRSGEAGQRFSSIAAASQAAAVSPSTELRHEVLAALALPDLSFVPVRTNRSPNLVAQFSPDFGWLAISGPGGKVEMVRIDDVQAARLPPRGEPARNESQAASPRAVSYSLPSAARAVAKLMFSPDGRFLAVQYFGGTNVIWDLSERRIVRASNSPQSPGAFGADSRTMLVAENSGTVRRLEVLSGKELWQYAGPRNLSNFAVQPQDNYFATAEYGGTKVQIRSMATGELVTEIAQPREVGVLAWSPDGTTLAIGRNGGWIETWQADSWTQTAKWKGHDDIVVCLEFEPGGRRLASASWDGSIRFWRVPGYQKELSTSGYQAHTVGRFSPDGHRYSCAQEGEVVGFLQLSDSPVFRRLYVPPAELRGAWSLDVTGDGKLLATGYEDALWLLDSASGVPLEWKPITDCRSALFTPDGMGLLTCGAAGLTYWPLERSPLCHLGTPRAIGERKPFVYAALSGDGQWVAAANRNAGLVEMVNINRPAEHFSLTNHQNVACVALSLDGRWLASGTWKGTGVRVWDLRSRQLARELPITRSASVAFSPDSKLLVTGSRSYEVWECGSWQKRYTHANFALDGSPGEAFSPDGRLLAVAKNPPAIEVLEATTGRVLAELTSPGSIPFWCFRFGPDGQTLLALESDRQIQVWDLRRIHQELAGLGLDWENGNNPGGGGDSQPLANGARTLNAASVPENMSSSAAMASPHVAVARPGYAFYFLAMGGVLFSVLIGIYILRYNFRMIRSYEEVENLVTRGNEELKSARIELLHNQKMRALGTLAAGIAHDFNNLLSVIRMSNKLVDRKARDRSGIQEHVSDIEQAVLQGKSLVGSMLGYARNETGTSGPVDVSAVVENAVSLLSKEFLSGIALSLELDRHAPKVDLGNSRLEQILLNLLVNASEAMEGHGKLIIRLEPRSSLPSRPYVLRPQPAEQFLELSVIDSGPGIAPEIKERLFEPFFTTKNTRSKPGTGLGLSLVYSIAQENGLGLSVENAPERGAAFSVVIPVHPFAPVRERHSSQIAIKA
jgi:signal transduction histidine kinase/WD40 repeat protein